MRSIQTKTGIIQKVLCSVTILALILGSFSFSGNPASASGSGPVGSFSLYLTDKGGVDQLIGSWTYDSLNKTFKDGSGVEAPFVKSFTGDDVLLYSGADRYIAPRMAVCTRGITIPDLKDYTTDVTGIPLYSDDTVKWGMSSNFGFSYLYSFLTDRYYYPGYIISGENKTFTETGKVEVPPILAITSYNQRNTNEDEGWTNPTTVANLGEIVPCVVDEASLNYAFGVLIAHADEICSLRVFMGQRSESPEDLNLGQWSLYNASCAGFVPRYLDISTSVTSGDGNPVTASIITDDGYLKAAIGEQVSFSIMNVTSGYYVDSVSITDTNEAEVNVNKNDGVYSFSMPESTVTIHAILKESTTNYTVNFINDNNVYSTVQAAEGSMIDAPAEPSMTGYAFGGWYTEESCLNAVTFPYTVNGDVNFYAKWTAQYTVTFIDDGTIFTTLTELTGTYIDSPLPNKSGYIFDCWCLDEALSTPVSFPYLVEADTTFYARWNTFDYNFSLSDNSATITGYTGNGGDVIIPSVISVNGTDYTVTSLGTRSFGSKTNITSVTIPDSVTNLGTAVFDHCSGLNSATLGNGITSTGNYMFQYCDHLTSLIFPDSFTRIGAGTFYGCGSLTSINLPGSLTSIDGNSFTACIGLTSITLPSNLTSLNSGAFSGCTNLESIIVEPASTTYSSLDGVVYTKNLDALVLCPPAKTGDYIIQESVTSIGDNAFYKCIGLTSVTIPDNVTSIGSSTFYDCSGLTSVTIPDGITTVNSMTFYRCSGLSELVIPSGVTTIGASAFYGCSGLTTLTIPEGVTVNIGRNCFSYCSNLTSIYFLGPMESSLNFVRAFGTQNSSLVVNYHISQASSWTGFSKYPKNPFCILTKDLQEGSTPSTCFTVIDSNNHIAVPVEPGCSGYSFGGWYKESECANAFVFDSEEVTGDLTLYARWGYAVNTLISSGAGTITTTPGVVDDGESAVIILVPENGYHLVSLTDNLVDVTNLIDNNTYTITAVTQEHNLIVSFIPDVSVTAVVSGEAAYDSDFTVAINIDSVKNFNVADYTLSFDPLLLRLDNVTRGWIDNTEIPVEFNSPDAGSVIIVNNLNMAATGISGSGTLAVLHFHVLGEVGQTAEIRLNNGTLAANSADLITASWVNGSTAFTQSEQTIDFAELNNKGLFAENFSIEAFSGSGLEVSFTASGNCTIEGNLIHITGAGECTITAHQSGNENYNAAPDVVRTFIVRPAGDANDDGLINALDITQTTLSILKLYEYDADAGSANLNDFDDADGNGLVNAQDIALVEIIILNELP